MRSCCHRSHHTALCMPNKETPATRLYYLHPLLAGPVDAWAGQLDRAATMRFDTVAIAPPFATGRAGDLFLTADHERLDGRLGAGDAVAALADFAQQCRSRGLRPMIDVVADRVAVEHAANGLANWYRADSADELPDLQQADRIEADVRGGD